MKFSCFNMRGRPALAQTGEMFKIDQWRVLSSGGQERFSFEKLKRELESIFQGERREIASRKFRD